MTLNFSSICRLCLGQKDGLLPLFGEDGSLPARIMTFAPVIKMFAGDSLPAKCAISVSSKLIHNTILNCSVRAPTLHYGSISAIWIHSQIQIRKKTRICTQYLHLIAAVAAIATGTDEGTIRLKQHPDDDGSN